MREYLNETQIREISDYCTYFLKDVKKQLNQLETKTGIRFIYDKQTNRNLLWKYVIDELCNEPNYIIAGNRKTFKQTQKENEIGRIWDGFIREHTEQRIQEKYKKEMEFLRGGYDPKGLIDWINDRIRREYGVNGLRCPSTFLELLEVDNYFKHFSSLIGEQATNEKQLKATNRIKKFYDELLEGVEDKENLTSALNVYLKTGKKNDLHNYLHRKYE